MTQGLLIKLMWVVLIILIAGGVSCAQDNSKATTIEPWVYQAMELLHQKGLVSDYPFDWVNSGNQLSRFEIAYYIKRFIVNQPESKDLPSDTVEVIQKLIAEFRMELTDLGIQSTDIYKISPNLATADAESNNYQDLDTLISKKKEQGEQPYYYYGQYFSELQKKSFIFIPFDYVQSSYIALLEGNESNIHIVYQPQVVNDPSFLVVKGFLPISEKQSLGGYYLFPIEENKPDPVAIEKKIDTKLNDSILALLDEVNQIQQVDSLWRFNGVLPLDGYLPMATDFKARSLVGTLDQGLKIGSLLIYTENPSSKNSFAVNNFGLPFYNPRMISTTTPIDLDTINGKNLQSLQINILGSMTLTPQTSLYGGVDILYMGTNTGLDNIWPSNAKASAGLNYHFNDYWTVLTYQSFVNSQLKTGVLSTTSVGVDYNDWVTLWLAYQLLNFDKPVVSGSVALRF
jgi:hypothetical protein